MNFILEENETLMEIVYDAALLPNRRDTFSKL